MWSVEQARFSFDWSLRLVLDRPGFKDVTQATMAIQHGCFYDDCPASTRNDVARRLLSVNKFFSEQLGALSAGASGF